MEKCVKTIHTHTHNKTSVSFTKNRPGTPTPKHVYVCVLVCDLYDHLFRHKLFDSCDGRAAATIGRPPQMMPNNEADPTLLAALDML